RAKGRENARTRRSHRGVHRRVEALTSHEEVPGRSLLESLRAGQRAGLAHRDLAECRLPLRGQEVGADRTANALHGKRREEGQALSLRRLRQHIRSLRENASRNVPHRLKRSQLVRREVRNEVPVLVEQTGQPGEDRKSTRLNSSHVKISYAVFCLKKKI